MYDMTQLRFIYKEGRKLDENYYVRFDKTTVYYYTLESVNKFFANAGFAASENLKYDTRELRNRKRMLNMYRVWVNGKFIK
jgi:tRNAThr (cytosine32-N3)-methyltransferase